MKETVRAAVEPLDAVEGSLDPHDESTRVIVATRTSLRPVLNLFTGKFYPL